MHDLWLAVIGVAARMITMIANMVDLKLIQESKWAIVNGES